MIKTIILILIPLLTFSQDLKEKTEQAISRNFTYKVKLEMVKYSLPADLKKKVESAARQRFFSDEVYIYKIYKEAELDAVAILDNVYGKSMPITFFVLMNKEGKIISSEVIKYREQYGGAVQNKSWTDQFKGKDPASGYGVGEDINTISGATISVNSVTAGIRKSVLLYKEIKDRI